MSALDIAEHHLNEALTRLERVMARRLAAADPNQAAAIDRLTSERDAMLGEIESLKAECARLSDALETVEAERDALRKASGEAAARLDGSIKELDRMIGE
jgi:chromosome segregation ATPase